MAVLSRKMTSLHYLVPLTTAVIIVLQAAQLWIPNRLEMSLIYLIDDLDMGIHIII